MKKPNKQAEKKVAERAAKKAAAKAKAKPAAKAKSRKPTQAQIGFHNICNAIRKAKPSPMSIEEFDAWSAPVYDAVNKQAEAGRKG